MARDGDGANGLYTAELLQAIRAPGLKIEDVFKRVRFAVQQRTRSEQVPWESSSLVGDFMFVLPRVATAAPAPAAPPMPRIEVRERERLGVGSLEIAAKVPGVEVWLGEQRLGEIGEGRALVASNVPAGKHLLKARRSGHEAWEREVEVKANAKTEVLVELKVAAGPPARASAAYELGEVRRILRDAGQLAGTVVSPDAKTFLWEVVLAQARAEDIPGAQRTAAAIPDGEWQKKLALKYIGEAQTNAGDIGGAMLTAASIQDIKERIEVLAAAARARVKNGERAEAAGILQQARAAAPGIKGAQDQAGALLSIVRVWLGMGEVISAMSVTGSLGVYPLYQTWAFGEIAAAQAKAGDLAGALRTAGMTRTIGRAEGMASAFISVAEAHTKSADQRAAAAVLDEGVRSILPMKDDYYKANELGRLAAKQAEIGEGSTAAMTFQEALRAAGTVKDDGYRGLATRWVAGWQARAGDIASARRTAGTMKDDWHKADALVEVMKAQLKAQDRAALAGTIQQANQIAAATQDVSFVRGTILVQLEAGDSQGALLTAVGIRDGAVRAPLLADIAAARARAGDRTGAAAILQQALQAAAFGQDTTGKANGAFAAIAVAQARMKDPQGAFQTFGLLQGEQGKPEAAQAITSALAGAGEASEALAWAQTHGAPRVKFKGLLGVAQGVLDKLARDKAEAEKKRG